MNEGKSYTVPIAILIAGLLIAGALVFTRGGTGTNAPVVNNGHDGNSQAAAASAAIDLPPITSSDHILGNPDADIVVVEYSDTECPFCKTFHFTLHDVIDNYGREGEVAWVYRHFPIEQLHAKAPREAEATECAAELGGNDGFWNYIDRLFEVTPSNDGLPDSELFTIAEDVGLNRTAFETCLESGRHADSVQESFDDARAAGGRGTPFSVIVAKDELNLEAQQFIASAASQFPPNTLTVSDDKTKVALSGALPPEFMRLILDVMLGKSDGTLPSHGGQ